MPQNDDKASIEATLAAAAAKRPSSDAGPRFVLSTLRYWDVVVSPTKSYMVAGHFVPSIKQGSFFNKKRRITIELYKPAAAAAATATTSAPLHHNPEEQTKKLFGELVKGLSSSALLPLATLDDNDMVSFRILKPKQVSGAAHGNDTSWDSHSLGSMSVSTLGFTSPAEYHEVDETKIRWKERFRCHLHALKVTSRKGRSCDLLLGTDSNKITKTIYFESHHDHQTFLRVLDQMNQLRDERGERLANSYRESKSPAPTKKQTPNFLNLPRQLPPLPFAKRGATSPSSTDNNILSLPMAAVDANVKVVGGKLQQGAAKMEMALGTGRDQIQKGISAVVAALPTRDVEEQSLDNRIQILVEIVSASNLPIADILSSDPYIKVLNGTEEIHRTKVLSKSLNPVWTIATHSLFLIDMTVEQYFANCNCITFQVKDYDAFGKNEMLGTVDVSKEILLRGTGERVVYNIVPPSKGELKRKKSTGASTLALRFRPAAPKEVTFMQTLATNEKRHRKAVYADETFLPPRDHHVSLMQKTSRKGRNHYTEYRVKPFPDPDRRPETTWMTEKDIHLEAHKPSKYWVEAGTGGIGKVYVEVLGCDNLPNLDISLTGRDKTDAFACLVFEDCIVNTDVINDCLSPRWMPWSQRAFVLNIMHPSSQIMVGVFDFDSGITDAGHDSVGRAVVNLANLRPGVLYTQTYELHPSARHGRTGNGSITLRLRVEFPDERSALLAGALPVFFYDVSVAEKQYFRVVYHTITHGEHPSVLSLSSISSYVEELQNCLEAALYIQPAVATVFLWRGHFPIAFRVPWWPRQSSASENAGCWGRWTRLVTFHLPLHSMILFGWGVALAQNFDCHRVLTMLSTLSGRNHYTEYRVKPFPDPDRRPETTWMTEKDIHLEAHKPSKYWVEAGTGGIGKVYVEVLGCDNLPNLDISLTGRDKTDAFACLVFEDCIVNTDVINDCLSPRWMPWSQRAFVLNIMHPSSQIMVGVFDFDSGITDAGHDSVGRAVVNLANLRPGVLYTQTYELHPSARHGRTGNGSITLRLRVEFPDERSALLAGALPVFFYDVSVAEKQYFRVVYHTITHGEHPSVLSLSSISSYVEELQNCLEAALYIQPAVATVFLWRGHFPIAFRVPWWPRQSSASENAGCWGRWTRLVTFHLPLHSMILFGWGVALAQNFDLFPAFLVFSIGWFLLATLELVSKRPSALYQPRSYLELLSVLVVNTSVGPKRIQPNENLEKVQEYDMQQAELKRARDEILKMIELEQQKYEAYIEAETSNLEEEVDITTRAHGGLTSLTWAPFKSLLLPLQHLLHGVCVGLRVTKSVVVWRDSYVSFWIVTACFVTSFIVLWIPWEFLIRWTFKISVWLFLGPWMKLIDIFYFRRIEQHAAQKKEDLAERFNERYQAIVGESLFRKLRKESALKMKDMKKYMFGQYLVRVPVFKEERFFDDPIPCSFAEPFDRSKFGEINIIERIEQHAAQKKEDLAERFNERYQAIVGESLFRKLRKESALKMKDMKKYMFGQYLVRVPVFKEERFFDDPIPCSFAEPFDRSKFGEINIIERKYGQLLEGEMIPHRSTMEVLIQENDVAGFESNRAHTEETEPLLVSKPEEDYGSTAPKRGWWSPRTLHGQEHSPVHVKM